MPSKKEMMKNVGPCDWSRLIANNTVQYVKNGKKYIRFHYTDIVTEHSDRLIELTSGGWKTRTTKERISWILGDLGFIVQEKNIWYLHLFEVGKAIPFFDGISFYRQDPTTVVDLGDEKIKEQREMYKEINRYAKRFTAAWKRGEIPLPDTGDCWFCCMRDTKFDTPIGELNGDVTHLQSHIEEDYFVPSLLIRALEKEDGSDLIMSIAIERMKGKKLDENHLVLGSEYILKSLRKYLKKQIG